MLRVATLRSCASAEAAIRLSLIGMERPLAFNHAVLDLACKKIQRAVGICHQSPFQTASPAASARFDCSSSKVRNCSAPTSQAMAT